MASSLLTSLKLSVSSLWCFGEGRGKRVGAEGGVCVSVCVCGVCGVHEKENMYSVYVCTCVHTCVCVSVCVSAHAPMSMCHCLCVREDCVCDCVSLCVCVCV